MIKQIYICECDICGAVEKAKLLSSNTNDENYGLPYDWCHGKNHDMCICPECNKKLNAESEKPIKRLTPTLEFTPMYGCPVSYEATCGVTVDPIIISANIPNTESKVVLDVDTAESSVLDCAARLEARTDTGHINEYLTRLKVYCGSLDSCEECPIAYFEEKPEYYHCSLTDTPVFEWYDIANKLKDEHKILAEHIEMVAKYCMDDMGNCEDCRYCRSYERCDLRLHNPADWVIYDDNNKRGE